MLTTRRAINLLGPVDIDAIRLVDHGSAPWFAQNALARLGRIHFDACPARAFVSLDGMTKKQLEEIHRQTIEILCAHPSGISINDLAKLLGIPAGKQSHRNNRIRLTVSAVRRLARTETKTKLH